MPGRWRMRLCLLSEHSRACTGMHTPLSTSRRSACLLHEKGTPDFAQQASELHTRADEGGAHLVAAYTIWSAMSSAQAQRQLAIFVHPQPSSRHQQECRMCTGKPFIIMLSNISTIVVLTCCERLYAAVYSICSLLIALLARLTHQHRLAQSAHTCEKHCCSV